MIYIRREPLPAPLRALAWHEPPDPETGRRTLIVVVDEALGVDEQNRAVRAAVRRL